MELKKDILIRTYMVFIIMAVFCLVILGKAIYIQTAEGKYWISMADSAHIRYEEIEAERGTIYSEDGQMLSTSVPEFDIYIDFMADGLRDRNGLLFQKNIDSLSIGLAKLFKDKNAAAYKKELKQGYRERSRYTLFKRKISFADYEAMKLLPLLKHGRNKSGFMAVVRMKRLYPFRLFANRTIGIARDSNKVGLEKKYDKYLNGITGKRLVRYIAGGAGVPVDGSEEEPKDGSDIVTTLDIGMQDAAQIALKRIMVENEAVRGTCIVLEVKTGKVKAIANLGRQPDGSYWEDFNYALASSEPGSTWKLVTLMSVLDDKLVNLNSVVDLEGGRWTVAGSTVFDSEVHGMHAATIKEAFEKSSNVGMAKLAYYNYYNQPSKFISHIHRLHLDSITGVDLPGEGRPDIHKPGSRRWSNTTIPWMGFGYNLTVNPMHTAMLYNAVANNGKMMKPYLVNTLLKDGVAQKTFEPVVLANKVCKDQTLVQLKACLEGVVTNGTGRKLNTPAYKIAGKTGTALVADKGITYADHVYQSSFAGYFPADDPQYTIVVVIRNKAHAAKFYGADVAGPVFREVSDRIFSTHIQRSMQAPQASDSVLFAFKGTAGSLKKINKLVHIKSKDSSGGKELTEVYTNVNYQSVIRGTNVSHKVMPPLNGIALKDALEICEERKLRVTIVGQGKVAAQSIAAGTTIREGQNIHLQLNK
ncbi:MAG: penicillin-binding protein [Bacteroidota bacterium]